MEEEALERDVGSATTLNFMPNGGLEQKSTGDSVTSGSLSPLRSNEKVQSRYLSPHKASCHDFCKYGKKHDSEAEARRLNFRKLLKKKSTPHGEQNEVTILVSGERRIRSETRPKEISEVETQFPDNTQVQKPQTLPSMKNSIASGRKNALKTTLENEQGRTRSPNPEDGKKVKMIKEGTPCLQSKPSPEKPNVDKLEDFSAASDIDASEQTNFIEKNTRSSVKKPISPVEPKVLQQKLPHFISEPQKIKQKVPLLPKRAEGAGKPAITLKMKTPLIRSLSQLKSSRSLIARTNQENKIIRSLGTPKNGGRELLKPSTASFSRKSSRNLIVRRNQDNKIAKSLTASKLGERKILKPTPVSCTSKIPHDQPRKLRSMKRTSTSLDSVSSLQPRKLRSIKGNSMACNSVSSMKPTRLRSIKRTSAPQESVSSLKPTRLRSIQRTSVPQESVSSLKSTRLRSIQHTSAPQESVSSLKPTRLSSIQRTSAPQESVLNLKPRNLWNLKQTSKPCGSVSNFQTRKLRSTKQSTLVKDKDKVEKAYTETISGDLVPDLKTEEFESAISGASDEEIKGNHKVEGLKDDETMRPRRNATATAPGRPGNNNSAPFKLKFRTGKVMNLRSDSIGARRLWFNIGSLASDNPGGNGLLMRRNFRRKKDNPSLDSKDPDSGVQSVVLKHQDVMAKKDAKSLFNHVIEETASKLVETRKSKVKALVGAFETVISLQESKPALAV